MSFNIGARTKAVKALSSGTVQTGTTNGDAIDLAQNNSNFRDVLFIITSGTLTDGTYTASVEESDASGSGYAAIGSHRLVTAAPSFEATDDNTVKSVACRPTKRYVRVVITAATATTGGVLSAVAVLANGSDNPPA